MAAKAGVGVLVGMRSPHGTGGGSTAGAVGHSPQTNPIRNLILKGGGKSSGAAEK